jgi:hypothetical protein
MARYFKENSTEPKSRKAMMKELAEELRVAEFCLLRNIERIDTDKEMIEEAKAFRFRRDSIRCKMADILNAEISFLEARIETLHNERSKLQEELDAI